MTTPDAAGGILTIDLDAVAANWRLIRDAVAPQGARAAAVVKADSYGLGADRVARRLAAEGCRSFVVASLDEGMAVRAVIGPDPAILVLGGPFAGCEGDFTAHDLTPVLNSPEQMRRWADKGGGRPSVLHVDTGMSRLGLTPDEVGDLADSPLLAAVRPVLLMSHLACADESGHPMNAQQLARLQAAQQRLGIPRASFANSSGVFLGPAYHFHLVRPGMALYGLNPTPGAANPMAPVVRLEARIIQVRAVDEGMTVGYGATHQIAGPRRLATVAAGYADGLLRSLSNRAFGWLEGVRVPLVGRVSMDLIIFDVTEVPEAQAQAGALVELVGPHQSADDLADLAGTIGYEVLTALGRRYHRHYLGEA